MGRRCLCACDLPRMAVIVVAMTAIQTESLLKSIADDDVQGVERLLCDTGESKAALMLLDAGAGCHCLSRLQSEEMVDVLLKHGLTTQRISDFLAPGFGLDTITLTISQHLVRRGVTLTPHSAAGLGLLVELRRIVEGDSTLVHAQGGDGCRPLHFARTVDVARYLVENGAEINARDDDHDSTPAQWRIREAPAVTRFLISSGATPDIFMAAGLGDLTLTRKLVEENPACTTWRIGNNNGPVPGIGCNRRGGSIYQWTLGFNQSPHEIARHRGHEEIFSFLIAHTPPRHQLLVACALADRSQAEMIASQNPGLVMNLDPEDRQLLAKFCWETNRNIDAVRLMLDLGFPVDVPETNHGYLPLHNAAWCGDPALVSLLLARGHPVDRRDPAHQSTALGYALHSCLVAKRHPEANFPEVVRLLLEAGVPLDASQHLTGHPALDAVINRFSKNRACDETL